MTTKNYLMVLMILPLLTCGQMDEWVMTVTGPLPESTHFYPDAQVLDSATDTSTVEDEPTGHCLIPSELCMRGVCRCK